MGNCFYCYKITNLINNKIYIGKTVNADERWRKHKIAAKRQDPNDYSYLHRAMNSYGMDNFKIEIIEEFLTEEESLAAEKRYIKFYDSINRDIGYNLTEGGEGSSGFKHSEETIHQMQNDERRKLFGENNPFYGKQHSLESKLKMSDSHIEYFKNNEHPFAGRKHTDEARKSISLSAMGRKVSSQTKKKMSDSKKGNVKYITGAKLSDSDVIKIKTLLLYSDITHKEIAEKFNVSRATITLISLGKTWSHIKI